MHRHLIPSLVALACIGSLSVAASADIAIGVANGQRVLGTIDPAATEETLTLRLPADATLTVIAKGKKPKGGAAPQVTFRVLDGSDQDVAAGQVVVKGVTARLKKLRITTSGVYRVVVTASTAGDYQVKPSWVSPKTAKETITLAGATETVEFAVDAGARCSFEAKAKKKSGARPVMTDADLTAGGAAVPLSPPKPGAKKHVVKGVVLRTFGDHELSIADAGAGGPVAVKITAVAPKTETKTDVEITSAQLGRDDARGEVLGPPGGGVSVADDELDGVGGAAVEIPAGALRKYTAVVLGHGLDVPVEGTEPCGPPLYFAPLKLKLRSAVTLTIPFDASGFPAAEDVQVAHRDARGRIELIDPATYAADLDTGLVIATVQMPGTFQVVKDEDLEIPAVPGDLNGDGIADIVVPSGSQDSDANHRNQLQVFFGRREFTSSVLSTATDVDALFTATGEDDQFGEVFVVADVSGDGRDDLIVGDRYSGVDGDGSVHVWFGGAGFAGSTDPFADADATITGIYEAEAFGRTFCVGDVTGDGVNDLVIAGGRIPSRNQKAAAYVFQGPITQDATTAAATLTIVGPRNGRVDVRACGNLTGNAADELVLVQGGVQPLGAYVFVGGVALTSRVDPDVGDADVFIGNHASDGYEDLGAFAIVADVAGDAYEDLVMTAPSSFGRVYVFEGGASFDPGHAGAADASLLPNPSQNMIVDTLVAPDLDGAGKAELVVPDRVNDELGSDFGSAFVYRDQDLVGSRTPMNDAFRRIDGAEAGAAFATFAGSGDVNADGFDDVWFSAPHSVNGPGDPAGAVVLFLGRPDLTTLPSTDAAADVTIQGQPGEYLGNLRFSGPPDE